MGKECECRFKNVKLDLNNRSGILQHTVEVMNESESIYVQFRDQIKKLDPEYGFNTIYELIPIGKDELAISVKHTDSVVHRIEDWQDKALEFYSELKGDSFMDKWCKSFLPKKWEETIDLSTNRVVGQTTRLEGIKLVKRNKTCEKEYTN